MTNIPRSADETIIRMSAYAFQKLFQISDCFDLPKGYKTIIGFSTSNMKHLLTDPNMDREWAKVTIKDMNQVEVISNLSISLFWIVFTLGRKINSYRQSVALPPINWVDAATEFDKRRKIHEPEDHNGEETILSGPVKSA